MLFVGDLLWKGSLLSEAVEKPKAVGRFLDEDADALKKSLKQVRQYKEEEPSLLIVPSRDPAAFEELVDVSRNWTRDR